MSGSFGTLFLDAGGVLLLPNVDEVRALLGIDAEEERRAHHAGMAAMDRTAGGDVYWPAFLEALGREPEPALVESLSQVRWTSVIEDSLQALRELGGRNLRIGVVSNADGSVEHTLLEYAICQAGEGPGTAVSAVIDSTVVGVEKPDPRIFEIALERLGGVDPAEAVHVGDSVHFDVGGARAAGVRPIHLDPYDMCSARDHEHVRSLADLLEVT